jgi:uncharacterized protein YxeA
MKKILLLIVLILAFNLFAETVWDGEDVTTDSTFYQLAKTIKLIDVDRLSIILENDGDTTSYYNLRIYSDSGYDGSYAYQGKAYLAAATMTDSVATFPADSTLIGQIIYNKTDGSQSYITTNTSTVITGVLSGGTDNTWAVNDIYKITTPSSYYSIADTLQTTEQATFELDSYYSRVSLFLKKTAAADSTVEFRVDYNLNIRR